MGILKRKKKREESYEEKRFDEADAYEDTQEEAPEDHSGDEEEPEEAYDYDEGEPQEEGEAYDEAEPEDDEAYEEDSYEDDGDHYESYDEDEYEGEEEGDEAEGEEDDDVFSLEEDLHREKVRQWTQYLVFATCAIAVIAVALYGSIVLTNRRIEHQKSIAVQPVQDPDHKGVPEGGEILPDGQEVGVFTPTPAPLDHWPEEQFPGIPPLNASAYSATIAEGSAEIDVPSSASREFDGYVKQLSEAGASVLVQTPRLSVLVKDGTEIHLVNNNLETKVVLCDEPALRWNDPSYAAFTLPDDGTLVDVREGIGAGSRVLVYRGASITDALAYVSKLMDESWTLNGTLEPSNNEFNVSLRKNNLQITVDYFSTEDNYTVRLDYLG